MRAVNIVLLVLAGALSGAMVMKLVQRPVRVAARRTATPAGAPAQPQTASPQTPEETKPAEVAEVQPTPQPAVQPPAPEPPVAPATPPARQEANRTVVMPRGRSFERPAERKPSPLHRVPAPVSAAMSPRVLHTPPKHVELQTPAASPAAESVTSQSPPVLPEQPKETPPARMEPENVTPASAPISASQPNQATLNAGMLIPVRLLDSLSSERNHAGDAFAATLDHELVASGFVIAERGARVEGRVTAADRNARTLSLELISIHTSDNQDVPVQTERFDKQSEPDRNQAAAKIGGGAAIGAVIGGLAGGGKGAAIGAGAGGGIGAGDVLLSRKPAALPSETRVTFCLRAPVTITERTQ